MHLRKLLENFQDSNLPLKSSELISDAEMSTRTKCEVWIFRTFQVETVRIFKLTSIAIGGTKHENDLLTNADRDAAELEVLNDHAARVLNGAFVPQ